jgi:hypothetical protein
MTAGNVIHAYGIVDAEAVEEIHVWGIGDAPVFYVVAGPVAAVVSQLDPEGFSREEWGRHAEDPVWLGQVASRHDAVLQAVAETTDVLPLRLPALYEDFADLERALRADSDGYLAALDLVRDHLEWSVKVFTGTAAVPVPEPRPSTGRDYLARKSQAASAKEEAARLRHGRVLDVHEALALSSTHATVNPPQDRALSGRDEPMLLNAAYLVPRAAKDSFLGLCEELADRVYAEGLVLEVSGPWPTYNFAGNREPGLSTDLAGGAP